MRSCRDPDIGPKIHSKYCTQFSRERATVQTTAPAKRCVIQHIQYLLYNNVSVAAKRHLASAKTFDRWQNMLDKHGVLNAK